MIGRYGRILASLLLVASLVALNACDRLTGGKDNSLPAAKLVKFTPQIKFKSIWRTRVGEGSDRYYLNLQPALDDSGIYAAAYNGEVLRANPQDGHKIWKINLGRAITGGVGLSQTAVLVLTERGQLLALAKQNGRVMWRKQLSSSSLSVPVAAGGRIFVQTEDGHLVAVDEACGKVLWVRKVELPDLLLRGMSKPVVWRNLVLAGYPTGEIIAYEQASGSVAWAQQLSEANGFSDIERMIDITGNFALRGGVVDVVNYQGKIGSFRLADGQKLWDQPVSSYRNVASDGHAVYVTDEASRIWAFDAANGMVLWQQACLFARQVSGPVSSRDLIFLGDFEGYLHALSAQDGKIVGRVLVARQAGIRVSPLVRDGMVYVYADNGVLAAYSAS